jgi:hypothetical protein
MRKIIFCLFSFLACSLAFAEERLKMLAAPDSREVETLMDDVAESCNSKNFDEFMSCFTKKRGSGIRRAMKNLFAKHEIDMKIISVENIENKEEEVGFDLKYGWDADNVAQKSIITSFVIAKKENGKLRIDSEKVKNVENIWKNENDIPNREINFGGGGQVVLNPNNNDDFLPRDLVKVPGNCANGRCNIK